MTDYKTYAYRFIGVRQGSRQHHEIVDAYNSITPLPDGYRLSYADPWCAGFASMVLAKCGAVNAPYSASVAAMKEKARKNKQIVKTPKVNDLILYNWNGDGIPDHVGIISNINSGILTVVEGNMSRAVGVRYIMLGSKYIDCFIRVKQSGAATDPDLTKAAKDVIAGKYGNGEQRKKALSDAGYDAKAVQALVNKMLK